MEPGGAAGVQHAVRTRASAILSFTLFGILLCRLVFSQDGLPLFHKMQAALGGAGKIAAIRDFEQLVRAESFDADGRSLGDVRKRTRWIRPESLRVDQVGPGSTYVLFFDGTSGWEILPGTQRVENLTGGELQFAQRYARDFRLNTWLADRDPRYRITSPAANGVRVSDGDAAHQVDLTLDPISSLPVKTAFISLSDPARPVPSEEVVAEWETVQGIRFARRWSVFRSGIRVATATVDETRLNNGLELTDRAAKPPDFKPVLSSR